MFADMMRYGNDIGQRTYDDRLWTNHPMMWWAGNNSGAIWAFGFLWIVTWILVIVVLISFIRWIWKKGDKVR